MAIITEIKNTNFKYQLPIIGSETGILDNQIIYFNWWGGFSASFEPSAEATIHKCSATKFKINIKDNGFTDDCTFTLRKNNADTALVLTVAAGVTGHLEATGSVDYAEGDKIDMKLDIPDVAGNPTMNIRGGYVEITL